MAKPSTKQGSLFETPRVIDLIEILSKAGLSKNEQGIIKRRLLENTGEFGKFLQQMFRSETNQNIDVFESLKELKKKEKKKITSFDSVAKILSIDFPELLDFILKEYEVEAKNTRALIGKEFVVIKRIADVIFEAKDKSGNQVIIHLEFEREFESDKLMDKRKLEYRQLMEMDDGFAGKTVLCNVFYLRGSPKNKEVIEDRIVKLPSTDPRFSGELKYKAYHLNQVTIDMMIEKNLPFLLPFIIQSELQNISDDESPIKQIEDIRQQIHENEEALTKMIDGLSEEKIESLRTIVEYMWQKSYSKEVFNKSTLLKLMKEQLNLRQSDVAMVITMERARRIAVANQMVQEGEITQKQMEKFLKRMEEYKNDSSNKST
jgi:hypothetical protein